MWSLATHRGIDSTIASRSWPDVRVKRGNLKGCFACAELSPAAQ
jgi:hypothetical protein